MVPHTGQNCALRLLANFRKPRLKACKRSFEPGQLLAASGALGFARFSRDIEQRAAIRPLDCT